MRTFNTQMQKTLLKRGFLRQAIYYRRQYRLDVYAVKTVRNSLYVLLLHIL